MGHASVAFEGREPSGIGLLTRTVIPTVPVTVTYELTDPGLSLHHLMHGVKEWAEHHMDLVLAYRAEHDTHVEQSRPFG